MKTATVSDLGEPFASISEWLEAGETVELTKNGAVYATIVPAIPFVWPEPRKLPDLDFAQRAKELFGGVMVPDENIQAALDESRRERL